MDAIPAINCPIYKPRYPPPCDTAELAPLLEHLRQNVSVSQPVRFLRGAVMEDGRLDLCKQGIGAEGCRLVTRALAQNSAITSLLLGTNGIGDAGASDAARLVAESAGLETLYLGCNHIGESGTAALADALTENATVTGLWLKRNPVGLSGAQHLAAMLRRNTTLQTLDLVDCAIGAEGLAALLDALLADNRSLAHLYLGGNRLRPEAAEPFAAVLKRNAFLRSLLLNVNFLGDDGAEILADGLRQNHTLSALGLASNGITLRGLTALLNAAQTHPLAHLDMGCSPSTHVLGALPNRIGNAGAAAVRDFLAQNPPLTSLNLTGNGITAQGVERLIAGMERNTRLRRLTLEGLPDPRLAALLERNRANASSDTGYPNPDALRIKSVYRTA